MKINIKDTFILMMVYIKNDYELDPETWLVGDILSAIDMFSRLKQNHTLSPTMDPCYWYDWKELIKEELEKDKSIIDEINGLTLEQGLVAIQYFLHHKYWVTNNDMLLKDAYKDLVKEYNVNKYDLEYSQLWRQWLAAVAEGKKFDKVFKIYPRGIKHLYQMFYSDKYSSEVRMIALLDFMRLTDDLTNAEVDEICELREIKDSKLFLEAMNSKFSEKINSIMRKYE